MSPEQLFNKTEQIGPATDVYSLGATLYVLLAGRPPVDKGDLVAVLDRVRHGDIAAPRSVQPAMPIALDAVCRKATALRPGNRYGFFPTRPSWTTRDGS